MSRPSLRVSLPVLLVALAMPAGAAEPIGAPMPVRGIVRPLHQAAIATDLVARVAEIGFREAEAFRKGDVLVRFDCERLEAEHAAAEAVHREMKLALESNLYLDKRGAIGKMDVEVSKARLDKAGAEAAALAARIRQCVVRAPFDGRIAGLTVNEHEIPANGKPFLEIVEERAFEIDLIVPSTWLRRIGAGTRFTFAIDETGRSYPAEVLRVGASVDPVSQTVKVIAGFVERDEKVLAGMSGTAEIAFPEPSQ
jgi:RND family efflux transporter MFP subunit